MRLATYSGSASGSSERSGRPAASNAPGTASKIAVTAARAGKSRTAREAGITDQTTAGSSLPGEIESADANVAVVTTTRPITAARPRGHHPSHPSLKRMPVDIRSLGERPVATAAPVAAPPAR
jgi:hypothetical protein